MKQVVGNWLSSSFKEEGNGFLSKWVVINIRRRLERVVVNVQRRLERVVGTGRFNVQRSVVERAVVNDVQERRVHIKNWLSNVVQRTLERRVLIATGNCSKKAGTVRWNGVAYGHGETGLKINEIESCRHGTQNN